MKIRTLAAAILMAVMLPVCGALAEFDAQMAEEWLESFVARIAFQQPKNDVSATIDPARAGERLLEFDFGTVLCVTEEGSETQKIRSVELHTDGVADCRGLRVGQTIEDVIAGRAIAQSNMPLYVLSTQESGYGWSWVYLADGEVYGVEYITYGGNEMVMKEYTLTYVIDEGKISAIRMKSAEATQAQADEGLKTAEEIAGRQHGEVLITENNGSEFSLSDMTVNGDLAVGIPVEMLICAIGEPDEIQTLPGGTGRILIYEQMVAELEFDEETGVEYVRSIICAAADQTGPRGLKVGMTMQETAGLFRCDASVYSTGGDLYLAGEAQGIAPYGQMICSEEELYTLRYTCVADNGLTGALDVVLDNGTVESWNLYFMRAEAAYGG